MLDVHCPKRLVFKPCVIETREKHKRNDFRAISMNAPCNQESEKFEKLWPKSHRFQRRLMT